MTEDNWITYTCIAFLFCVLILAIGYASNSYAQTVIAQCDDTGRCITTREILEVMLNYIQHLEMGMKGKCA